MSLLQMLPERVTPIVMSGNPKETEQRYGVESSDRLSLNILPLLKNADTFIWGGGSLIQDVTSLASPIYYSGLMALAQKQGLKTIAWAQGIGPLNSPFTRWLTQEVLRHCTAVTVRDNASAELLANWQIPVTIAPDPVWALKAQPVSGLWELPAPRIAVTLRAHPQLTPQRLAILTQALIDLQTATQACILLVPFQPSQDLAIAHSLAAQLRGNKQIITINNPREIKGLFRGVEMAIAMRFHSLIMAAAAECRCFALSYDPKVSQLMSQLNLPGWELNQLPDDPNIISTAWLETYVNGDSLNSTQINSLIDRALIHRDILHQILIEKNS